MHEHDDKKTTELAEKAQMLSLQRKKTSEIYSYQIFNTNKSSLTFQLITTVAVLFIANNAPNGQYLRSLRSCCLSLDCLYTAIFNLKVYVRVCILGMFGLMIQCGSRIQKIPK